MTLTLAGWLIFAPSQLGGQVSYLVVSGNSMEPALENGDLAIVRAADWYQEGDVVLYRHAELGAVIHRIVGRDYDHFLFKGDNNSWMDSYRPRESDLVGALWLKVPYAGLALGTLRNAGFIPILGGLGGAIAMISFFAKDDKRQTSRRPRAARYLGSAARMSEGGQSLLTALGMALAAFGLLAAFSFSQSAERSVAKDVKYEQAGVFTYRAEAPVPWIYDWDAVTTGDPVFHRLTSAVDFAFSYRFTSGSPSEIGGTHRLVAVVSDAGGWKRTFELDPATTFAGDAFAVSGTLDLEQVRGVVANLQNETGLKQEIFDVAIVPEVTIAGKVAGQDISDAFFPKLPLRLDPIELQMVQQNPREADPRTPSQIASITLNQAEPNTLSLLGLKLGVADARRLAIMGLFFSVVASLVFAWTVVKEMAGDEPSRIQSRFGAQLVTVQPGAGCDSARVIELASVDDLAKVAQRLGVVILHDVNGTTHRYSVQDGDICYRYQTFGRGLPAMEPAPELAR